MDHRKILVAEDDRTLAETLAYNLKAEGFEPSIARTGFEPCGDVPSDRAKADQCDALLGHAGRNAAHTAFRWASRRLYNSSSA